MSASILCLALALTGFGAGEAPAVSKDVEDAGAALRGGGFPWYDRATDSEQTLIPPAPEEIKERTDDRGKREFSGFGISPVLVYSLLGVIVAGLVYFLIRNFDLFQWNEKDDAGESAREVEIDRIEALPMQVRRVNDFLAEAKRCVERGDLEEAMIYLYSYQLITLDKAGAIHLAKGKTNRIYLRELMRKIAGLADYMTLSIRLFEETFFGKLPIDRDSFFRVWNEVGEFEKQAEAVA